MACNTCAKPFSFLRPEKGCPSCGFSYCSKCLNNKIFLKKLNSEAKVCIKCMRSANTDTPSTSIEPPKAYYERIQASQLPEEANKSIDSEIQERLKKLKDDKPKTNVPSEVDIADRLKKIKGEVRTCSDEELQERLANLRGVPVTVLQSKPVLITSDQRTEHEQANDLMKQYMEEANINTNYKDEFDSIVTDIESRLKNLKQSKDAVGENPSKASSTNVPDSDDEDEIVRKIIEKAKAESRLDGDELSPETNDELPFCEICNEDARMRCLGCRYLFCKRCFLDHKDDDDGCNRYEPYTPPRNS